MDSTDLYRSWYDPVSHGFPPPGCLPWCALLITVLYFPGFLHIIYTHVFYFKNKAIFPFSFYRNEHWGPGRLRDYVLQKEHNLLRWIDMFRSLNGVLLPSPDPPKKNYKHFWCLASERWDWWDQMIEDIRWWKPHSLMETNSLIPKGLV